MRMGRSFQWQAFCRVISAVGRWHARYVYAVATLPEYRGRGLAARILKFAQEYDGQPLLLAPAEKTLMDYYEKLGFVTAFAANRTEQEVTVTALSAEEAYETKPLTAQEYVKLRDEKLQRDGLCAVGCGSGRICDWTV